MACPNCSKYWKAFSVGISSLVRRSLLAAMTSSKPAARNFDSRLCNVAGEPSSFRVMACRMGIGRPSCHAKTMDSSKARSFALKGMPSCAVNERRSCKNLKYASDRGDGFVFIGSCIYARAENVSRQYNRLSSGRHTSHSANWRASVLWFD